jgi:integrase
MWLLNDKRDKMPTSSKLTKSHVDGLVATSSKPTYLWDSQVSGFGVKALPSGKKRYVLKYRSGGGGRGGTQRWLLLGTHGSITVDEARKIAQQASASIARGEDPQANKEGKRVQLRMGDLWSRFERDYLPQRKAGTQRDYKRYWDQALVKKFGTGAISELTRADVDKFHKSLRGTPYEANRILALLSRLMSLAEAWGLRGQGTNPCKFVQRFKEEPRSRYLTAAELTAIGKTLQELIKTKEVLPEQANAIRVLLYTGARLNEILTAKVSWVDWERRVIALPDSKTGKKLVYLSDQAILILRQQEVLAAKKKSEFLFPGRSADKPMINLRKPWVRVCEKAGIEGVRLHDLRHTAASLAVGQGVSLPVIGRLLGHSQAQTTLRYAHVDNNPALAAANLIGSALGSRI